MIDQNDELPEGTDSIVAGASVTSDNSDPLMASDIEEQRIVDEPSTGEPIGEPSRRGRMADKVRTGGNKLADQAAGKTRGLVGQGLERSSEALANVSKLVGDTAAGLDDRLGTEYGDYARRAAGAIEGAANSLASKSPDELIDGTRDFVKKSPGIALAGAAVVGFVLARLVKTGLDSDQTKA
ncbi:MAG: hypothetical protein ABIN83_00140 [Sphingomicrobium sp.]